MTGPIPSITTTRLAERQQITGLNTLTIKRRQSTSPRHNGVHGSHAIKEYREKHVSKTRILQFQPNSVLRILFTKPFCSYSTEHKVELPHKFCRSTTISISKTQRLPALAGDVTTLYTNKTKTNRVRRPLQRYNYPKKGFSKFFNK